MDAQLEELTITDGPSWPEVMFTLFEACPNNLCDRTGESVNSFREVKFTTSKGIISCCLYGATTNMPREIWFLVGRARAEKDDPIPFGSYPCIVEFNFRRRTGKITINRSGKGAAVTYHVPNSSVSSWARFDIGK